jgi:hypothetical protein
MRADVADFKHTLRYRRGSSCYRARRPFMVTTIPVFSMRLPTWKVELSPLRALDLRHFSGEHFGQFTASLSNFAGLVKSSAEWRRTGL